MDRNMTYNDMHQAIQDAERVLGLAQSYRNKMLGFLIGRLRGCDRNYLKTLKKELQSFNAQTGQWR